MAREQWNAVKLNSHEKTFTVFIAGGARYEGKSVIGLGVRREAVTLQGWQEAVRIDAISSEESRCGDNSFSLLQSKMQYEPVIKNQPTFFLIWALPQIEKKKHEFSQNKRCTDVRNTSHELGLMLRRTK